MRVGFDVRQGLVFYQFFFLSECCLFLCQYKFSPSMVYDMYTQTTDMVSFGLFFKMKIMWSLRFKEPLR